jgi:exosortase D (VPLPA-CTERM-specific)
MFRNKDAADVARQPVTGWVVLGVITFLLGLTFADALRELWRVWGVKEEYSYGYFVPAIALFLVWLRKDELEKHVATGSWWGTALVVLGVILVGLGELSGLYLVVQYALVTVVAGLAWAYLGTTGFRRIAVPIAFLIFMIPLPQFFLQEISGQLQLVSSQIGVAVIRAFGISVFLEGNVIDLGTYRLQVVEACSGLRYLFPLMTFGFLCAYLFKAPAWQRIVVFASTVPLTVLLNSLRIGIIGVLVEYFGQSMAEGFLHDFEGWAVFMVCVAILLLEVWLLARLQPGKPSFASAFGIDWPKPGGSVLRPASAVMPMPVWTAAILVLGAAGFSLAAGAREEVSPVRAPLEAFPETLGDWHGRPGKIERLYLDELRLTDYALIDYRNAGGDWVNFYVAYYASQRKGESSHSPRTCIPGGGWKINDISTSRLPEASAGEPPFTVNRAEVQRGESKMLVYYWFDQRGRTITNEYLVKWFLFWDAFTANRTDGALVRLTTPLRPDEDWAAGDARLARFVAAVRPRLSEFVPR